MTTIEHNAEKVREISEDIMPRISSLIVLAVLWTSSASASSSSEWMEVVQEYDSPRFTHSYYAWGADTLFDAWVNLKDNPLRLETHPVIFKNGNTYAYRPWTMLGKGDITVTVNAQGEIRSSTGHVFTFLHDTVWEGKQPVLFVSRIIPPKSGFTPDQIEIHECASPRVYSHYAVRSDPNRDLYQDLTQGNVLPLLCAIRWDRLFAGTR